MTCDLAIDTNGDIAVTGGDLALVAGRELLGQEINVALKIHLGEWAFDTRAGLPWATWLSEKPARPFSMQAKIRALVAGIDGVQGVDQVLIEADYSDRTATVDVEYREASGVQSVTVTI